MKQVLGRRKHRLCEAIAGKQYRICYTRGGWEHGRAECHFGAGPMANADAVNYLTREWAPLLRDGEYTT